MSSSAVTYDRYNAVYVGGEWVVPPAGSAEAVVNPATEAVIGHAPVAGLPEAEAAIASARSAFDRSGWPRLSPRERVAALETVWEGLRARRDEIVQLIVDETGMAVGLAGALAFDSALELAAAILKLGATDLTRALPLEMVGAPTGEKRLGAGVVRREPMGVVAIITPYNFPFLTALVKAFQALVTGNTVVLKPSPFTPYESLLMAEVAHRAQLPAGVFNVITGGQNVGEMLTTDRRIDLVSFTGSDAVGARIQAQSAPTLKRLVLELGGKSPMIVRKDADLAAAAMSGLFSIIGHAGQACGATTRHLVHNDVRAAFVAKLGEMAANVRVGSPYETSTDMGPLIRESQRARVGRYVDEALSDGAKLVFGGRRPADLDRGFYYEPTLFDEVNNDFVIAQEEIFGPVGVVIGFDSDDEAIALANESNFGLYGSVYSADAGRAFEIASQLRTGGVLINGGPGNFSPHAPFGGIKRSGYGREYGIEGLHEYTYAKAIRFSGV